MRLIVTGGAGFIGSHLCERLLERGHAVLAVDNFDTFYDPRIKRQNVADLSSLPGFSLVEADVSEPAELQERIAAAGWDGADAMVHLAARAGVRPSIADPLLYSRVNVEGTLAALETARKLGISRFVFGSSSSVYGNSPRVPFSESDPVDHPISPYAATKRAAELLCSTYHHLYGMSVVCLRFFTVYGPRQRPDLAIHKFARMMDAGEPIPMYGDGTTERDYTYVDDILQGIEAAIGYTGTHPGAFEIVNLGESRTVPLRGLVDLLADAMGASPRIEWLPPQPGDVERTYADIRKARDLLGYAPETPIEEGLPRFVDWFRRSASGLPPGASGPGA
ncbi:MAG TPA: NAD-dependent epimerase/dehydratase family protein [Longimicrobiaceae bacterium]|nr:NAD-dependent epimerase/dehydratase family protein [Longimicrobiaceae bacterium]